MQITPETIFQWATQLAMVGWLLLMFSPRRWTWVLVITGFIIPGFFGWLYGGLIFSSFSISGGDFGSIEGVRKLFENDQALLAGWLHYLAFDLAIGTYIARKCDESGILRIIQIPILFLPILFFTFMFGPVGYAVFLITRAGWMQLERGAQEKPS